jgi:hypothetical protein
MYKIRSLHMGGEHEAMCVILTFEFRSVIKLKLTQYYGMHCSYHLPNEWDRWQMKPGIQVSQWGLEYPLPPYQISPALLKWFSN